MLACEYTTNLAALSEPRLKVSPEAVPLAAGARRSLPQIPFLVFSSLLIFLAFTVKLCLLRSPDHGHGVIDSFNAYGARCSAHYTVCAARRLQLALCAIDARQLQHSNYDNDKKSL